MTRREVGFIRVRLEHNSNKWGINMLTLWSNGWLSSSATTRIREDLWLDVKYVKWTQPLSTGSKVISIYGIRLIGQCKQICSRCDNCPINAFLKTYQFAKHPHIIIKYHICIIVTLYTSFIFLKNIFISLLLNESKELRAADCCPMFSILLWILGIDDANIRK